MRVVIDFMNLLHAWIGAAREGLPLPPDDLPGQVNLLGRLLAKRGIAGEGSVIVCDGALPPGWSGEGSSGISVRFAGPGREADEVIEGLIAADTAPRRLLVVSSDRRILRAGQRRRARTATSEAFLNQVARAPGGDRPEALRPDTALDDDEIARWLDEFGLA